MGGGAQRGAAAIGPFPHQGGDVDIADSHPRRRPETKGGIEGIIIPVYTKPKVLNPQTLVKEGIVGIITPVYKTSSPKPSNPSKGRHCRDI